jgi:uncharacterized protein (TIGR02453 family)
MLQNTTIQFLKDLRKNNNREWFEINKPRYEKAKDDFAKFIDLLLAELRKTEPGFAGLTSKDCIFRIYRDVRFSKNKEPYKPNFGAAISIGGKKSGKSGLYIHIEPSGKDGSFLAGGNWMPEAPLLKQIRQEIEYNSEEFKGIISNRTFKKWYGEMEEYKLKKAPKGVDPEHPDVELLKYTSFVVSHPVPTDALKTKELMKTCVTGYKTIKPFLDFLNRADH